jgi:hypothetical protein
MAGGGIFLDDVGAGDVGRHQVRRELDALEQQAQGLRHGADEQRLGGAGQAGDETMAAHKQGDHHLLQHLFLSDDHAPDLAHNFRLHFAEPADAAAQGVGF